MPDSNPERDDERTDNNHPDPAGKPWRDETALEKAWADCETVSELADHFNIGHTTARKWLDYHGIRERLTCDEQPRNEHDIGSKPYHHPETLAEAWEEHDTLAAVADHFEVDDMTISRWLDRHDLRDEPDTHRSQLLRADPSDLDLETRGGEA